MSYKKTIGLEVHVELKTNTKLTSSSSTKYGETANTLLNEVDLAYPGTLPTINKEAINLGIKCAHILNCEINKKMHFDRKNYFYPDNPKNYQITQNLTPIGYNGYIEIEVNDEIKKIGIERIHIEEDTAKSNHFDNYTLLDFNRSSTPLIEIVTKPDIKTEEEAVLFLEKLRELLSYSNISDVKIEEGSMRVDVNVSVSKTSEFGVKTEVKNIGSISNVALAIKLEEKRQIALLEKGEKIFEETRRLDEKNEVTILMRTKESKDDYRYMLEPNIPYLYLEDSYINDQINNIPILPSKRREIYKKQNMSDLNIDKIINNKDLSDFLLNINKDTNLERASNILLGDVSSYLNKTNKKICDTKLTVEKLSDIVLLLDNGDINNNHLKSILNDLLESDKSVNDLVKSLNIVKLDDSKLESIIDEMLSNNKDNVIEYKNGKTNVFKYLVGQVMKETKGSANPKLINDILEEKLNK